MENRDCGVLLQALYVEICKDMLLYLLGICVYQALVGTQPLPKIVELGPTFLLLSNQITKERRNSSNRESWALMSFITNNFYRTSILLLRITERLNCYFMYILKSCTFNLYINSVREEYLSTGKVLRYAAYLFISRRKPCLTLISGTGN